MGTKLSFSPGTMFAKVRASAKGMGFSVCVRTTLGRSGL
jgi:hypothetical protein